MTKLLVRLCAPILLLGLAAAPATAAQTFYFSLMGGQASADDWSRINGNFTRIADLINPGGTAVASKSSSNAFRGAFGYRFSDNMAVEIDYVDAGEFSISSDPVTDLKYVSNRQHAGAYLVGFLPTGASSELYGKVGVVRWELDETFTTLNGAPIDREKIRGNDLSFGAGFNYHLMPFLDLTFGYARIRMNITGGKQSLDEYMVGVNLGF